MSDIRTIVGDESVELVDDPIAQLLRVRVRRSAVAYRADLADESSPLLGAGLLSYLIGLAYPRGSMGDRMAQQAKSLSEFGVRPGNTAAENDEGFAAARAWALLNKPCALFSANGVIQYTDMGNWAIPGVSLHFDFTEFVCTSAVAGHVAFLIHAFEGGGAESDPIIHQVNLSGNAIFTLNANCAYGVRQYGLGRVHSTASLRVRGGNPSTGRAFSIEACSLCDFGQFLCSTDIDPGFTMPSVALYIGTGTRAGVGLGRSTNCSVRHVDFAGVGTGIVGDNADQWVFESGAAESCIGRGVSLSIGARNMLFKAFAAEGNGAEDIFDAGENNRFINCYSVSPAGVVLGGRNAEVCGGTYERIETQVGAPKNHVHDLMLGRGLGGSGGFFDNGTGTKWSGLYGGAVTASFSGTTMTVVAVTPGVRIAAGQKVFTKAGGDEVSTTILSQTGGTTGGAGEYQLAATLGELTSRAARADHFIYPVAAEVGVAVGASPFTWRNDTGEWIEVYTQGVAPATLTRQTAGVSVTLATAVGMPFLLAPNAEVTMTHGGTTTLRYQRVNSLQA